MERLQTQKVEKERQMSDLMVGSQHLSEYLDESEYSIQNTMQSQSNALKSSMARETEQSMKKQRHTSKRGTTLNEILDK